mmetsp:Transcript_9921/g.26378  ORF Transcript_9921/g.26378 Transcript_9921/m.26378 type:complete len:180 (+) Transcript_9921:433-972(+)
MEVLGFAFVNTLGAASDGARSTWASRTCGRDARQVVRGAGRSHSPQRSLLRCCAHGAGPAEGSHGRGDEWLQSTRAALENIFVSVEVAGSGETACLWCTGSGKCSCAWCNGQGHRMEMEMKSAEAFKDDIDAMIRGEAVPLPAKVPVRCSACRGTKLLACRYCRGSGSGSYGFASAKSP